VNLSKTAYANVLVLSLDGRLDHDNCAQFQAAVGEHLDEAGRARARAVVFDLSRLEYVSSAGLRSFMLAAKQARGFDCRLLVAAMQPVVAEIFEISRFNLILDAFPTVRAALQATSPESALAYDRA
jgi:anti-sigma B factor antagonist